MVWGNRKQPHTGNQRGRLGMERERGRSCLMMEEVRISETSVNFYETTQRNILEGCHLRKSSPLRGQKGEWKQEVWPFCPIRAEFKQGCLKNQRPDEAHDSK
jgi:hypothetical protein